MTHRNAVALMLNLALPCTAWAQSAPLAQPLDTATVTVPASAQSAAIGDELYAYLATAAGGESSLIRLLTGGDKATNQTVSLVLRDSDVIPGDLTYTGARFEVVSRVTTLANCGSATPQTIQDTQSGNYVTTATWSAAQSQTTSRSHTISVKTGVSAMGASLSTSYSFTNSTSDTASSSQGSSQTQSTQWATQQTIQAAKDTTTVFRHDLLTLSGGPTGVQYSLTPRIAAGAPLTFVVQTTGLNTRQLAAQIFGAGGPDMVTFSNLPAPGQTLPAGDATFPDKGILWSADGRYAYGREVQGGKYFGNYTVVDLGRTQSASAPARVWSAGCQNATVILTGRSTVTTNRLTVQGDATWACSTGALATHSNTSTATRACRFVAFNGTDSGQLACYDRDVSQMSATVAQSYRSALIGTGTNAAPMPAQQSITYAQYSVPLSTLQAALKLPAGALQLSLTGTYTGANVIEQASCSTSLTMDRNPHNGSCRYPAGMSPNNNSLCPQTADLLRRKYHRRSADAVSVLSGESAVAGQ